MMIDLQVPAVQTVVASVVGTTKQAINAMITEGKLPADESMGGLILAYCGRLREQAAGRLGDTADGLDPAQESAALKRAQREGQEIKNAVLRGEYASISLLAEVLATASQSVSERFEQIPGILRKTCPDMTEDMRDRLMTVLSDARNEWVRATAELVARQLDADDMDGEA
jgi:phage terminase Nu1 subunit (DNA packaging protein)